jgi:imidazolonepropionase-like amidohydrolase
MCASLRPLLLVAAVILLLPGVSLAQDPCPVCNPRLQEEEPPPPAAPDAPEGGGEEDGPETEEDQDRWLAVVGGDVYTVSGPVLRGATILVKNRTIRAIGTSVSIPEGAEIIPATGFRVYPGIVAVRSSGLGASGRNPEDAFNPYGFNLVLALAHGITTVSTGDAAVKLTYGSLEDHVLKRDLFVRVPLDRRNPDQHRKLRQDLEKVREYLRQHERYELQKSLGDEEAKEPDAKWLKGSYAGYLKLLRREKKGYLSATSRTEILTAARLAADFSFDLVIERATEAWTIADDLGRSGVQVVLSVRQGRQPAEDPRSVQKTGWTIENASILHAGGVPFAIIPETSSISTLFGIAGRDLLAIAQEAGFAVRGGLSEEAALRSITLEPARILGVDARVGSLEVGKDADIIVTDGDLLHYNTWVQWAVVNGRIVYDKEKESLVRHIRSRHPETAEELIQFWPRRLGDSPGGFGTEKVQGGSR